MTTNNELAVSRSITEPIIQPATGELVDLSAATNALAAWLDEYRALDSLSRTAKTALTQELANRLDYEGKASHAVGDWKVSVNARDSIKYDPDITFSILKRAVALGLISEAAAEAAVPPTGKRKIAKRELDRVAKLLPDDLAAELNAVGIPDARRITLTRLDNA